MRYKLYSGKVLRNMEPGTPLVYYMVVMKILEEGTEEI